jgi:hypothetical protein
MDGSIFQVGYLQRLPLGTTYPQVVSHVVQLLSRLPVGTELVIDYTGVGRPVYDMFIAANLSPIGVLISGGTAETQEGSIYSVPKINLVSRLQALLHEGRLKIHKDLTDAPVLVRELQDYRTQYTPSGALTFNARTGRHDDLVLALAVAAWRAYRPMLAGWAAYELARRLAGGVDGPRTVIGLDLGQAVDFTAIAVVRRVPAGTVSPAFDNEQQRRAPPQPGSENNEDMYDVLANHPSRTRLRGRPYSIGFGRGSIGGRGAGERAYAPWNGPADTRPGRAGHGD